MADPCVEFWFDFASTYSHVAALRIERVAVAAAARVLFRPFLLGPIFTEQLGIRDSPFNVFPVRGRYMWRDVERLCAKYGLPWRRPSEFPRSSVLASRAACALDGNPALPAFVTGVFRANFAEDRDIGDAAVVSAVATSVGVDGPALLARAGAQDVKDALRARTAEASRTGMFGAPSFVAAGELFFGQDRMEDAFEWAVHGGPPARAAAIIPSSGGP